MTRLSSLWALLALQASTLVMGVNTDALYKDPSQPVEVRVQDLLSRMTIEDKTAQLMQGEYCLPTPFGGFQLTG